MRALAAAGVSAALVLRVALAQEAGDPQEETAGEAVEQRTGPLDMTPARDPLDVPDAQKPVEAPAPSSAETTAETPADVTLDDEEELPEERWLQMQTATLRGLDKITGRKTDFVVTVGEPHVFGSLSIELQTCFQKPPEEPPESASFLQIKSLKPMGEEAGLDPTPVIFSGWMFASSPGLSALEHAVYDVWVIECETPEVPAE